MHKQQQDNPSPRGNGQGPEHDQHRRLTVRISQSTYLRLLAFLVGEQADGKRVTLSHVTEEALGEFLIHHEPAAHERIAGLLRADRQSS